MKTIEKKISEVETIVNKLKKNRAYKLSDEALFNIAMKIHKDSEQQNTLNELSLLLHSRNKREKKYSVDDI